MTASEARPSDPLRGALWMLGAAGAFTVMWVVARHLSGELHPLAIVFWRNGFGLILLLGGLFRAGPGAIRPSRPGLHAIIAVTIYAATAGSFFALSVLPVAAVTALSFTVPLFATIGAALVLKETVRIRRWLATVVGFAGALIILRPGYAVFQPQALIVLGSAMITAITMMTVRILSRSDSAITITVISALAMTPLSLMGALPVWTWPAPPALALLVLAGAAGSAGMLCFTRAFAAADASAVLPFDYARLIFAAVLGYLVFRETPDAWTWLGATVIFGATLYTAHRERLALVRARDAAAPARSGQAGGGRAEGGTDGALG